jgi:hypothetical protein
MTLQLEFGVVLLSNLRAVVGIVAVPVCAYAIWQTLKNWKLRGRRSPTIWWIVLVLAGGACFWLLGRWSRVPILAIMLVVAFSLVRRITKHR